MLADQERAAFGVDDRKKTTASTSNLKRGRIGKYDSDSMESVSFDGNETASKSRKKRK